MGTGPAGFGGAGCPAAAAGFAGVEPVVVAGDVAGVEAGFVSVAPVPDGLAFTSPAAAGCPAAGLGSLGGGGVGDFVSSGISRRHKPPALCTFSKNDNLYQLDGMVSTSETHRHASTLGARVVIVREAIAARSEALAQSKNPCQNSDFPRKKAAAILVALPTICQTFRSRVAWCRRQAHPSSRARRPLRDGLSGTLWSS